MNFWDLGPIQIIIISFNFYMFGFLYGILGNIVSFVILVKVLSSLNLELLTGCDLMEFFDTDEKIHNCAGIIVFDHLNFEQCKEMMIEKGVERFKRLRSVVVRKFGFIFWKEISAEEAIKNLVKVPSKDEKDLQKED